MNSKSSRVSLLSTVFVMPAAALVATAVFAACGGDPPPEPKVPQPVATVTATATAEPVATAAPVATSEPPAIRTAQSTEEAKILSFARGADTGKVDKVGMADGSLKPDGQKDASFAIKLTGPVDAFFIAPVDKTGEPTGDFQADTLVGKETMPNELAKHMHGGKTLGIAVYEGDKLLNGADGSLRGKIGAGEHTLTLYIVNAPSIKPGKAVRVYAQMPDGTLVASTPLAK